jgi:hypothetical protein
MGARFSELCIDAVDPFALAEWWGQVLGCPVHREDDIAWLEPPDTVREIVFAPVPEPKTVKDRIHIDLSPHGCDQATELQRLLSLGATQIDVGQGEQDWVVLADPAGNVFCLPRGRFHEACRVGAALLPRGAADAPHKPGWSVRGCFDDPDVA